MLHLLYMLVFSVLAVLAVGNLLRSMFTLGRDVQQGAGSYAPTATPKIVPHPELLDDAGQVMNEPLLVMRSLPIEDVRSKLDAIYDSSPGGKSSDSSEE